MPAIPAIRRIPLLLVIFTTSIAAKFEKYTSYPGYGNECFNGGNLGKTVVLSGGADGMVLSNIKHAPLTEFTVCWWMKSEDSGNQGILVDYSDSSGEKIKIENPGNLLISVNAQEGVKSGIETNYGLWHHVCLTWTAEPEGMYEYYKDGRMLRRRKGLATNQTITDGGDLALGKHYVGEITQFNMWSYRLQEEEIQALSEDSLNYGCGDVVMWSYYAETPGDWKDTDLPQTPAYPRYCVDEDIKDTSMLFNGFDSFVTTDHPIPDFKEFTISFWIKVIDTSDYQQTILSYFVEGDSLGSIVLEKPGDLTLTIRNTEGRDSNHNLLDNAWHHVCVTWLSWNGQYKYYLDGATKARAPLAVGLLVRGGGSLVLGQKQVIVDGLDGFDGNYALSAEMAHFNMWQDKLSKYDILDLYTDRCERVCGDVIWWPYLTAEQRTSVEIQPNGIGEDLPPCVSKDQCDPGVLDGYLWKVNNTGDWSLAPLPKNIPDLNEFSICYWMSLDDKYGDYSNVVFSYFVQGDTEGSVVIENVNDLVVIINNKKSESTGVNLNNHTAHFICLSWSSKNGDFTIHDRKDLLYVGTGLAAGETIHGGGALVIGQKQSVEWGGFNKNDAFNGKLRYFNFYSYVLNKRQRKLAVKTCIPDCGDIVSWHELTYADLINIDVFNFTCGGSGDDITTTLPPTTPPPTTPPQTTPPPTTPPQTTPPPTTPPPITPSNTTSQLTTLPPTTPPPTFPSNTTSQQTTPPPTTPPPTTPQQTTPPPTTPPPTTPSNTTSQQTTLPPTTPLPTTPQQTTPPPTTPPPTTPSNTTSQQTTLPPTTPPPATPQQTTPPPTTPPPTTPSNTTSQQTTLPPTTPPLTTKTNTTQPLTTSLPTTTPPTIQPLTTPSQTTQPPSTPPPTTLPPTTPPPTTTPSSTTLLPLPQTTPSINCLPERPSEPIPCPDTQVPSQHKEKIPGCYTNIALGKTVDQSSSVWYSKANHAVDGNTDTSFCEGSCTITRFESDPWFRIDLGKCRTVEYVTITKTENCPGDIVGAEVRVGNYLDFHRNNLCAVVANEDKCFGSINLECENAPLAGRYVTVESRCNETTLCLCEVEVWTDDDVDELILDRADLMVAPEKPDSKNGFYQTVLQLLQTYFYFMDSANVDEHQ
ncbi:uncharacterized protein LOC144452685 [Glandiceps talaboti]